MSSSVVLNKQMQVILMTKRQSVKTGLDNKLFAIIADEDTCVGFLIAGIGDVTYKGDKNYFIVYKNTKTEEISNAYYQFLKRLDIAVILITQDVAEKIRKDIERKKEIIPTVLEIPSPYTAYDLEKDFIITQVKANLVEY